MVPNFKSFSEEADQQNREKLKILKDILESNKSLDVREFVEEDRPYIYVKISKKDDLYEKFDPLGLGIKIFPVGKKLVYRLQQGIQGNPVGEAKTLEKNGQIEDEISKGKSETKAYKDVFTEAPKTLTKFMDKVLSNLEVRIEGKPKMDMDIEKRREILNSIVGSVFM